MGMGQVLQEYVEKTPAAHQLIQGLCHGHWSNAAVLEVCKMIQAAGAREAFQEKAEEAAREAEDAKSHAAENALRAKADAEEERRATAYDARMAAERTEKSAQKAAAQARGSAREPKDPPTGSL